MSWLDSTAIGDGRSSIRLTDAVPTCFKCNGSPVPEIDAAWLRRSDASSTGLTVTDRDGAPLRAGPAALSDGQPGPAVRVKGFR